MLFALQKLRGCQLNPRLCSINPAMAALHNLTPVYIKGATKQKCEIQRNLTNTVLSRWIKFIAGRTRADVSAIQVNAIVATPTVINQALVDIWRKIMNVYKIWMWTSTSKMHCTRVSMGWWLLRLSAQILALLRLSVNFFQLRLTKNLKINFFGFKKLNIN